MAERVLSVVVDGVIANAMSLASEHISSVWGFKEEIGKLQVSLTKIQALLHDAEKKQLHDESLKIWLRQLKDVAYEADDVLDEYDYEILRQKVETQNQVRSFFSSSNPVVFPVKMAKRIKTINQSLDEIKKDIPLLGLIASLNPIPQTGLERETDSFIDGSEVVGRSDDVFKIVNLLIGANNQQVISVIPIVGETLHLEGNLGDDIDVSHTRRLSLISDGHTTHAIPLSEDGVGRLRTVFLNRVDLGEKILEFKCARSLSLFGSCIRELPESIGNLIHLRFLHIEDTYIRLIPNSVSILYNLQTLVIKNCRLLKELPKDLRNLINLRHIDIDNRIFVRTKLPTDIGRLTCLQTLPFFDVGQDIGGQIEELGCLSQLRGELSIYNLEHVRDKEEAKTANLVGKAGLQKLGFYWNRERDGNNNDEDVLEGLQPHPSLKSLEIENFKGEKFPSWILACDNNSGGLFVLDHLLKIRLENCNKCNKLPTLGHLPLLKVLRIERMDNVTCIGTEFYINYGGERSSNSGGGSGRDVVFPALKKLVLRELPNLVEWKDATELTTIETVFPCLEKLRISSCGQLTSAPYHFPSLKKLAIYEIKSTAFERIISKLTTLTSLQIEYISELVCLPEQLLQNNRSLMSIDIKFCSDLVSVSPHQDVTSLQSFKISGCEKLSELLNAPLTLPSLETFEVSDCPNLRSFPSLQGAGSLLRILAKSCGDEVLPTVLQSCPSLSSLSIKRCPNLILIPELRKLHSLTNLEISNCPNLQSIPDLGELHSLTHLRIFRCQTFKCLPEELKCINRLKYLEIGGFCEELDAFPSLSSIQHLHTSLESLRLWGWAKLNSLPDEIQHFTSLEYLYIHNFDGLEALPEWLSNFSSLQTLELWFCKNLIVVQNRPYSRCHNFMRVFPKYVSWHYGEFIRVDILLSPLKGRMCRGRKSSMGPFVYYMKIESLNIQQIACYSYPLVALGHSCELATCSF
ncbi:hypothetical protein CMV_004672 [Castanea mollissima]|uniref:Rx N-terminal domain-containing protein n=1 Tax=Castanea mollissima TaxID=60419 RepID=A0A8J4RU03_9ROSI|nr:hypothetical protein CMV_004672 [Castanea mollissima]